MDKKPYFRKRGLFRRLFRTFLKILLAGFLLSIIYVVLCKWVNPPITLTQLSSVITSHGLKRDYIDYNEMGENIKLAVLAGEDQLFPDHNGFDFKSIQKAMKHNQKSKSLRGASTISQQVAKNVFLWQDRSYFRKALEVYFTFMIEEFWGKKRILEMYLNVAQTGDGIFGVEAAARYYFKKPAKDLTRKEAAMIASCLPNPVLFTIKPISSRVSYRYPWIMRQMNNLQGDKDIEELLK